MNLEGIFHVGLNVANMDRSVAFYKRLGFEVLMDVRLSEEELLAACASFGSESSGGRVVFLRLANDPKGLVLDLVEWDKKHLRQGPVDLYKSIGIGRIAITAKKPEEIMESLKKDGIPLLGPPLPLKTQKGLPYVAFGFHDPDGNIVEIISSTVRSDYE